MDEIYIVELWKQIPGYENYYEISHSGKVRSIERKVPFLKRTRIVKSKIIQSRINNRGYEEVRLSKNGITSTKFVHIITAKAFVSNPNNKPEVNHMDGNKINNHFSNLEWVTHSENMSHAYNMGLIVKISRPVIDNCTGEKFKSTREAAKVYEINYHTLRNYLSKNIKRNPTCLEYLQTG